MTAGKRGLGYVVPGRTPSTPKLLSQSESPGPRETTAPGLFLSAPAPCSTNRRPWGNHGYARS